MQQGISRRTFGLATAATAVTGFGIIRARADEPIRLRCSLDTAPSHLRNVSVADYFGKLEAASGGRIKTEIFHSGQLFADLDVAKALMQGQVEMAVPGAWTITGFVPDADFFQLPAMYGRSLIEAHKAIDGTAGARLGQEIEQKLRSHVLGSWLDLGYQNWYTTHKQINSLDDLKGMKIRSPGGAGITWRIKFADGLPNTTAWPNVPLAISQGTFDGLISTNQSLQAAKLWEAGAKYTFEDHQFIGEYIPMVSNAFWGKLTPDLQKLMTDLWAQNIGGYRANMEAGQIEARKVMLEHGVVFVDAKPADTLAFRKRMMAEQDQAAKEIKVSPEMVKAVMHDLGEKA